MSTTAAQMAIEGLPDFSVGRRRIAIKQCPCGHDHAKGAKPAVRGLLIKKCLLQFGGSTSVFTPKFSEAQVGETAVGILSSPAW